MEKKYGLRDKGQALRWTEVEIIDHDLGVTASETTERAGFERLAAV